LEVLKVRERGEKKERGRRSFHLFVSGEEYKVILFILSLDSTEGGRGEKKKCMGELFSVVEKKGRNRETRELASSSPRRVLNWGKRMFADFFVASRLEERKGRDTPSTRFPLAKKKKGKGGAKLFYPCCRGRAKRCISKHRSGELLFDQRGGGRKKKIFPGTAGDER